MKNEALFAQPSLKQSLLECRAVLEVASLMPSRSWLNKAPRGDNHPVLVLPGFMAADNSTQALRTYLGEQGYNAYAWELGTNPGLRQDILQGLQMRIKQLAIRHQCKVTVIGWSLGGLYARALGHLQSEQIRQIVTLGSPFNVPRDGGVTGTVARLYQWLNKDQAEDPILERESLWRESPPVPTTSIYTEGDGVAAWQYGLDHTDKQTENLRVRGSHVGLTHNPFVLYAIADRLAQAENQWRPFKIHWSANWWYRQSCASEL